MASRKICTPNGFTLIEVVIVMALVVLVAGFGLFVSMESYRGYSFRTERDNLIGTLQEARSEAVNNMCFGASCTDGRAHGVHIGVNQYVLFQGESYASRDASADEVITARYNGLAAEAPSFTDIVFSRLAGTSSDASPNTSVAASAIESSGSPAQAGVVIDTDAAQTGYALFPQQ